MQRYRKLIRILRTHCHPAYKVDVRRVKMKEGIQGTCSLYKKTFYIRLDRNLPEDYLLDVLIHEWSHSISWNYLMETIDEDSFDEKCHDASWGVAYSQVYRIYQKYLTG